MSSVSIFCSHLLSMLTIVPSDPNPSKSYCIKEKDIEGCFLEDRLSPILIFSLYEFLMESDEDTGEYMNRQINRLMIKR